MSKQHRTKHIKSLEDQLAATNDPKIKADISRQLTKLLSKTTRKGSSRKPEVVVPTSSTKTSSPVVAKWAARFSYLSYENQIMCSVEEEVRDRLKSRGIQTTYPETPESSSALHEEVSGVIGSLSVGERAALDGCIYTKDSNKRE